MTKEFITYDTVTTHLPTAVEDRITTIAGLAGPGGGTVTSVAGVDPDVSGDVPSDDLAAALNIGGLGETVNVVATTGSTETLPAPSTATVHDLTLTADCAITLPTLPADSKAYSILVTLRQPHSGGSYEYTATWVGTVAWSEGGDAPQLANGQDAFSEVALKGRNTGSGATWEGSASLPNPGNQGYTLTIDGSGNVATPADLADVFDLTLTRDVFLSAPTGLSRNKFLMWAIRQDATGGWTIDYDDIFRPSSVRGFVFLSITGNKTDYLLGRYNVLDSKIDLLAFEPGF
jgi:hypothetical protein